MIRKISQIDLENNYNFKQNCHDISLALTIFHMIQLKMLFKALLKCFVLRCNISVAYPQTILENQ